MVCPKCGQEVPEGQKFCGNCGAVVTAAQPLYTTQLGEYFTQVWPDRIYLRDKRGSITIPAVHVVDAEVQANRILLHFTNGPDKMIYVQDGSQAYAAINAMIQRGHEMAAAGAAPPLPEPLAAAASAAGRPATGPSIGALVLSGLVVIGTLLPWAQVFFVSLAGVQSDGVFSLAGGILGVVGGLDGLIAKRPRTLAGILVLLGGLLAVGMAISVAWRLIGLEDVRVGAGLWLTVLAGIGEVAAGLAVLAAAGKRLKSA